MDSVIDKDDMYFKKVKDLNKKEISISLADRLDGDVLEEFTRKMSGETRSYKLSAEEMNKLKRKLRNKPYQILT